MWHLGHCDIVLNKSLFEHLVLDLETPGAVFDNSTANVAQMLQLFVESDNFIFIDVTLSLDLVFKLAQTHVDWRFAHRLGFGSLGGHEHFLLLVGGLVRDDGGVLKFLGVWFGRAH